MIFLEYNTKEAFYQIKMERNVIVAKACFWRNAFYRKLMLSSLITRNQIIMNWNAVICIGIVYEINIFEFKEFNVLQLYHNYEVFNIQLNSKNTLFQLEKFELLFKFLNRNLNFSTHWILNKRHLWNAIFTEIWKCFKRSASEKEFFSFWQLNRV